MSGFRTPQVVTVWTSSGQDGFGNRTWTRTELDARVADRVQRVRNTEGDLIDVRLAVYTRTSIPVNSFVQLGSIADLEPPQTAIEIQTGGSNPTMSDMFFAYG